MFGDPNAKYKVPGRQIWTHSLRSWLQYSAYCHVVLPLFRDLIPE